MTRVVLLPEAGPVEGLGKAAAAMPLWGGSLAGATEAAVRVAGLRRAEEVPSGEEALVLEPPVALGRWALEAALAAGRAAGEDLALTVGGRSGAFLEAWGRPVVFVYSAEAHGRGPGFWDEVRMILGDRWGEVFLIGDYRSPGYNGVFDGVHTYIELDLETAEQLYDHYAGWRYASCYDSFEEALRAASEGELKLSRRIACGTVVPGYDDRKIRSPGRFLDRGGGSVYEAYWDAVEAASLDWVLITSWNEWHEGTEIEPSIEEGSLALRLTAERSAAFKGDGAPTMLGIYLVDLPADDGPLESLIRLR